MVNGPAIQKPSTSTVSQVSQRQAQQVSQEVTQQAKAMQQPQESPRARQARELREAADRLSEERRQLEIRRAEANRKGQKQLFRDLGDRIDEVREQRSRFLDRSRELLGKETIASRQAQERRQAEQLAQEVLGRELTQGERQRPGETIERITTGIKRAQTTQVTERTSQAPGREISSSRAERLIAEKGIASTPQGTLLSTGEVITPDGRLLTRQQAQAPASFEGRRIGEADVARILEGSAQQTATSRDFVPIASTVTGAGVAGTIIQTDQGQVTIQVSPTEALGLSQPELQTVAQRTRRATSQRKTQQEITYEQFIRQRQRELDKRVDEFRKAKADQQFTDPQTGLPISREEAIRIALEDAQTFRQTAELDIEGKLLPADFLKVRGRVTADGTFQPIEDISGVLQRRGQKLAEREDIGFFSNIGLRASSQFFAGRDFFLTIPGAAEVGSVLGREQQEISQIAQQDDISGSFARIISPVTNFVGFQSITRRVEQAGGSGELRRDIAFEALGRTSSVAEASSRATQERGFLAAGGGLDTVLEQAGARIALSPQLTGPLGGAALSGAKGTIPLLGTGTSISTGAAVGTVLGAAAGVQFVRTPSQERGEFLIEAAGFGGLAGAGARAGSIGARSALRASSAGKNIRAEIVSEVPVLNRVPLTTSKGVSISGVEGTSFARIKLPNGQTAQVERVITSRIATKNGREVVVARIQTPRQKIEFIDPKTGRKQTIEIKEPLEEITLARRTDIKIKEPDIGLEKSAGVVVDLNARSSAAFERALLRSAPEGASRKGIQFLEFRGIGRGRIDPKAAGTRTELIGTETEFATILRGFQQTGTAATPKTDTTLILLESIQGQTAAGRRFTRPEKITQPKTTGPGIIPGLGKKGTVRPSSSYDAYSKAVSDATQNIVSTRTQVSQQRPGQIPERDLDSFSRINDILKGPGKTIRGTVKTRPGVGIKPRVTAVPSSRIRNINDIIPTLGITPRITPIQRTGQIPIVGTPQKTTTKPIPELAIEPIFPPLPPQIRFPQAPRQPRIKKPPRPPFFLIPGFNIGLGGLGEGPTGRLVSRRTPVEDFTRLIFG